MDQEGFKMGLGQRFFRASASERRRRSRSAALNVFGTPLAMRPRADAASLARMDAEPQKIAVAGFPLIGSDAAFPASQFDVDPIRLRPRATPADVSSGNALSKLPGFLFRQSAFVHSHLSVLRSELVYLSLSGDNLPQGWHIVNNHRKIFILFHHPTPTPAPAGATSRALIIITNTITIQLHAIW